MKPSNRIKRFQPLTLPQEVDKVDHRTVEVPFHKVDVIALRGFIYRQARVGTRSCAVKFIISAAHNLK